MRQLGIFAKTFAGSSISDICIKAKTAGYEALHYNFTCAGLETMPSNIPSHTIDEIQDAVKKHQMPIVGISGTFNMGHPNQQVRSDGLTRLASLVHACTNLNVQLISLCTGTRHLKDKWSHHVDNASPEAWSDLSKVVEKALILAEDYDVTLGIEPEYGNIINSASKALHLLKQMRSHHLKIIFDPANIMEHFAPRQLLYKIKEAFDLLAEYMVMAHAKGRTATGQITPPGQGDIPFDNYVQLLDENCPNIPLIVHGVESKDASMVSQYLRQITAL